MKRETYLVIGSDSKDDLKRIAIAGNIAGVNLLVLDTDFPNMRYDEITIYKKGLDALLLDDLSGVVIARCSYTMLSSELKFWSYLERLAKKMDLKVLCEWELRKPEKIDFDSLKNPDPELQEKMLKITRAFKDAVQDAMDSEEEKDAELKAYLNGLYGLKSWNRDNNPDPGYPNVFCIYDTFPGPDRPVVNINISIGGRRNSRGDQTGEHGSGCNDSASGSREPRYSWDAPGCRCSSKPDGQSKISE